MAVGCAVEEDAFFDHLAVPSKHTAIDPKQEGTQSKRESLTRLILDCRRAKLERRIGWKDRKQLAKSGTRIYLEEQDFLSMHDSLLDSF